MILNLVKTNKILISATAEKTDLGLFMLNLACDYRIVTDDFTIGPPETKFGLVLRDSAEYFLAKIMGDLKASEIIISGLDIRANEMFKLGLVNEVVPAGDNRQLINNAVKRAWDFALASPMELKRIKKYQASKFKEYLELKNRRLLDFIANKADHNK